MLTAEQLEIRAHRCGSSDVAQILGLSTWGTPFSVWASKTGKVVREDQPETPPQKRGRILESAVADWYAEETGAVLTRCDPLTIVGPEDWMCCSPDRWVDLDGRRFVLEIKTAKRDDGWAEDGTEATGLEAAMVVGPLYASQVLWMMENTGCDRCDVAVLFMFSDEFRRYTIWRDPEQGAQLVSKVREWWQRHVVEGEQPPIDGSSSASAWLLSQFPRQRSEIRQATAEEQDLAERLHDAEQRMKAAEAETDTLANQLRAAIGESEGLRGPFGKLTWKTQAGANRLDTDRLRREMPETAAEYSKQGAPTRVFRKQWAK